MQLTMSVFEIMRKGVFDACRLSLRLTRDREHDLQKQLDLSKTQLRDLRASHDTNQAKLIDHTQRQGSLEKSSMHDVSQPSSQNRRSSPNLPKWT